MRRQWQVTNACHALLLVNSNTGARHHLSDDGAGSFGQRQAVS